MRALQAMGGRGGAQAGPQHDVRGVYLPCSAHSTKVDGSRARSVFREGSDQPLSLPFPPLLTWLEEGVVGWVFSCSTGGAPRTPHGHDEHYAQHNDESTEALRGGVWVQHGLLTPHQRPQQ